MSYLFKSINVTILDLIIVAVIGGLLVNLCSFLLKKALILLKIFYKNYILDPIRNKKENIKYNQRLKQGITDVDFFKIEKKKKRRTANEMEIKAYEIYRKERLEQLLKDPDLRKNQKKIQVELDRAKEVVNKFNKK